MCNKLFILGFVHALPIQPVFLYTVLVLSQADFFLKQMALQGQ